MQNKTNQAAGVAFRMGARVSPLRVSQRISTEPRVRARVSIRNVPQNPSWHNINLLPLASRRRRLHECLATMLTKSGLHGMLDIGLLVVAAVTLVCLAFKRYHGKTTSPDCLKRLMPVR